MYASSRRLLIPRIHSDMDYTEKISYLSCVPMEFHPVAQTLLTFITLIAGVSAIGWSIMAYPLKIAPKASLFFASANYLILFGLLLNLGRSHSPSYLHWFLADQCVLLGFVFMHQGMTRLFKLKNISRFGLYAWFSFAVLMLTQDPSSDSLVVQEVLFSLSAAINVFLLTRAIYQGMNKSFSRLAAIGMSIPSTCILLVFITRILLLAVVPEQTTAFYTLNTAEAVPILWAHTVLNLLLNIMMFACALARLISKIRRMSERDQLTDLYNRRAIRNKLDACHEQWSQERKVYSLILFDIDRFKSINDNYGHHVGDNALVFVASLLRKNVPLDAMVSRYGGEEFLVLLPNYDAQACVEVANQLRAALPSEKLHPDTHALEITASFGCATIADTVSVDQLIVLADHAMYGVKAAGRNGVAMAKQPATA